MISSSKVSSSSGTCTSRRVQVEETIAVTLTRMSAPNYANASQFVGVVSSQLITLSAPLHSSQNASHPTQSNANLGTVAGLDIDWSALF
ncbi:hypothetical protein QYF36_003320 [Acer negundo]|nr:hypothetical protein QYF36_003320 [Acer negundo]